MGAGIARDLAYLVESGMFTLDHVLAVHLTSNHLPPLPNSFVRVAREAIKRYNRGDTEHGIRLPPGMLIVVGGHPTRNIGVIHALDKLHLWDFVRRNDEDD